MYNSILDDLQRDYSWYSSILDDLQREYLFFRGSIHCTVHTCIWCLRECSLYCTHLGDLLQDVYYVVLWNPYFLLHLNINSSKIASCVLHIFFLWSSHKRMYHSLSRVFQGLVADKLRLLMQGYMYIVVVLFLQYCDNPIV